MGAPDPEQAILEELSGPPGQWEPGETSPGGWQSGFARGGHPFLADVSTVRFVKHRQSKRRHLYFVTFEGAIPHLDPDRRYPWRYLFPVERAPDGGWRVGGSAGGAGDEPRRSTPWVDLAGGGWPDQFYAGGSIHHAGIDIGRVELRFSNGLTLQDDTDAGVALFVTDQTVQTPATLAILDLAGNELALDRPFPDD